MAAMPAAPIANQYSLTPRKKNMTAKMATRMTALPRSDETIISPMKTMPSRESICSTDHGVLISLLARSSDIWWAAMTM